MPVRDLVLQVGLNAEHLVMNINDKMMREGEKSLRSVSILPWKLALISGP